MPRRTWRTKKASGAQIFARSGGQTLLQCSVTTVSVLARGTAAYSYGLLQLGCSHQVAKYLYENYHLGQV
jgi:hypothetical protein